MIDRKALLASALREAAIRAKEEDDLKAQIARVTALAKPELDKLLAQHKAESGREVTCPHCNEKFTVGYRTDDVTSDTQNDDDVNEQDGSGPASAPAYDNRRPSKPLSGLTRAQIMASLNKIRC
jgi:hypothetical protein